MGNNLDRPFKIKEVVEESAKGSEKAFQQIFDYLSGKIFAYVVSRVKEREEALDITQEVFVDLWRIFPRFRYKGDEAFFGLVFLIARRRVIKYYRSYKPSFELDEKQIDFSYEDEHKDSRYLNNLLSHLKPKFQEVIRLRYWADLSFKEIARTLNAKESTVKVWHHRAIRSLQQSTKEL